MNDVLEKYAKFFSALPRTHLFYLTLIVFIVSAFSMFIVARKTTAPLPTANISRMFYDPFGTPGVLNEAASREESTSPYWWLNSGAAMSIENGTARTAAGDLPTGDFWQMRYANDNPVDTDDGYHPQNIFRLFTKNKWANFVEDVYFLIDEVSTSSSPNRNSSNGVLLFARYQDEENFYYGGVRVDGYAVIKKKKDGVYHTIAMGDTQIFPGTYNNNNSVASSLLPMREWVGIRILMVTLKKGVTMIQLYTDIGKSGTWTLAVQGIDDSSTFGGSSIEAAGYAGIRSDFMTAQFDDYRINKI